VVELRMAGCLEILGAGAVLAFLARGVHSEGVSEEGLRPAPTLA
jgi:hypothetical protein